MSVFPCVGTVVCMRGTIARHRSWAQPMSFTTAHCMPLSRNGEQHLVLHSCSDVSGGVAVTVATIRACYRSAW
eukprot:3140631-Alexandrium_andersonii.AAC.1